MRGIVCGTGRRRQREHTTHPDRRFTDRPALSVQMRRKTASGRAAAAGIDRAPNRVMMRSVLIPDAAELLGVSRRTVYYRIREGMLKTVRTRGGSQRVLMESIEAALRAERQKRHPTPPIALRDAEVRDAGPSTGYFGPARWWF